MTRTNTADSKAIESGLELFKERGFQATSVDDICKAAGISKGSFYHFFKSKEEFGLEALKHYYAQGRELLMEGPFRKERDPVARAFAFLDHVEGLAAELWKNGCLLGTPAAEGGRALPPIQEEISRMFTDWEIDMAAIFAAFAGPEGSAARPDGRAIARHYLTVIEGAVIMAQAHGRP